MRRVKRITYGEPNKCSVPRVTEIASVRGDTPLFEIILEWRCRDALGGTVSVRPAPQHAALLCCLSPVSFFRTTLLAPCADPTLPLALFTSAPSPVTL